MTSTRAALPASPPDRATAAPTRECIATVVGHVLRMPVGAIDARTPFSLYGLDSLSTFELTAALERAFGVDLSPTTLYEHPHLESLEKFLRGDRNGDADAGLRRMLADAVLPDDVAPSRREQSGRDHRPNRALKPHAVLLTGATGFLGAHCLRTLLRETDASVHALVRAEDGDGFERIRGHLERHGLWEPRFSSRVFAVEGDITLPRLGLPPARYARLAGSIGAIYHGAARVNWVLPYAGLRESNVAGTLELLRLAFHAGTVPFHFVSSLAVCYATTGPREVDERDLMLDQLAGLHLGYAQCKCVAEALVRQAASRGLQTTIVRPALLAGDSRSGVSNTDDVVSSLIKGCIQMGCAPDLDWTMDQVPVENAAEAVVRLSKQPGTAGRTFHLSHPRPRNWRECVLWMRLYGYPLSLVPYREWTRRLEAESRVEGHALRALAPFFLRRPQPGGALTVPELYEDGRRSRVRCDETRIALERVDVRCAHLDAGMLGRYFASYIERGFLPPPAGGIAGSPRARSARAVAAPNPRPPTFVRRLLESALRRRTRDGTVRLESVGWSRLGADDGIISELTSWRSGVATGLFRARLTYSTGGGPRRLDVVVKRKPSDTHVIAVGEAVARLCDEAVGHAYAAYRDRIGFAACHRRELAVYAQHDARFRHHTPTLLAARRDDARGEWVIVLEHLGELDMMNADGPAAWRPEHIRAALRGIAEVHAIWYGREWELARQPWIGHVKSADSLVEMTPLWRALAAHASPMFENWIGRITGTASERLLRNLVAGWRVIERQPRTLIHNDFNPRNVALRRDPRAEAGLRLCAYDWELAALGPPQHDVAEFLCFALMPDTTREAVEAHLDLHRRALEGAAGVMIDPDTWREGFRISLLDLFVDRFAFYALVHRFRTQRFLPRVVQTWAALHRMFP